MQVSKSRAWSIGAAIVVVVSVAVFAQGQAQGQQTPPGRGRGPAPQNLQVLPKDWTLQQAQAYMRTVAGALGVECSHCHVGTPQDRAKDDKPEKLKARKMLQILATINNDLLKDIGDEPAPGTQKVTCYTCHRGALKPATAPMGGGN